MNILLSNRIISKISLPENKPPKWLHDNDPKKKPLPKISLFSNFHIFIFISLNTAKFILYAIKNGSFKIICRLTSPWQTQHCTTSSWNPHPQHHIGNTSKLLFPPLPLALNENPNHTSNFFTLSCNNYRVLEFIYGDNKEFKVSYHY